mgnify:CR=1 FL=1
MRQSIREVFPGKSDAWKYKTGFEEAGEITPPPDDASAWLRNYVKIHPFCQQLAHRYITLWKTLEGRDMTANGKTLFPHQQALFSWMTIGGLCAETRDKLPAILLRSPYGTGKSLVGGLGVEGAQDLILDAMARDAMGITVAMPLMLIAPIAPSQ